MRLSPRREILAAAALAFTYATLAVAWPILAITERLRGARRA